MASGLRGFRDSHSRGFQGLGLMVGAGLELDLGVEGLRFRGLGFRIQGLGLVAGFWARVCTAGSDRLLYPVLRTAWGKGLCRNYRCRPFLTGQDVVRATPNPKSKLATTTHPEAKTSRPESAIRAIVYMSYSLNPYYPP